MPKAIRSAPISRARARSSRPETCPGRAFSPKQARMPERVLFLTGHLARGRLERVLAGIGSMPFEWRVHDIGVKVAALMTEEIIRRRLPRPVEADRIIVPGRCHADLGKLSTDVGVRVERGPDDITDLPRYLGAK